LIIEPGKPIKTKYMNFGIVNHLFYTDRERVLTLDKIAGFDWVRQQVVWKDVEGPNPGDYAWGELDNIVNDVSTHNLKLLVNVVQAPSFYNETNGLPQDPKTMGNLVEAMVQRYGDKIAAYEIWNEQNLAHENGGRVTEEDAGHYVEILAEAYNRIKALNPNIIVLAGAPSSSGVNDPAIAVSDENYYRAMYRYKDGMIKNHFDAQGVHPGGSANPPDTMWPDNPSQAQGWTNDPTFYFRHIENVRKFMEEEGVGDHQIWITEFGWATENNTPGYEFGNQVSFDQQSDYITGAIKWSFENYRYPDGTPWLGNMFLWNMNFAVIWAQNNPPNPLNEQASFGILNPDYSPRPAFLELQGLLPQLKQQQGR
jgi:polysaccharide biosynthesis protein PslG